MIQSTILGALLRPLAKAQMSLSSIKLRYYTDDEIRALAVVRITHAGTYDRGVPKLEGLNDPRLGLVDHTIRCPTCFKSNCDQHYGYIELARPVYRVGIINTVIMILRMLCRECAKPKFSFSENDTGQVFIGPAITSKNAKERLRIISDLCRNKLTCTSCGAPQPLYTRRARAFIDATYRLKELSNEFVKARGPKYLKFLKARFMPDDAAAMLHHMDPETRKCLELDRPEALVAHLQIVPPPNIRPSNFVGETKVRSENDMTCALQDIVRANGELKEHLDSKNEKNYELLYDRLQVMVSGLVNNAIKKSAAQSGLLPMIAATSKRKIIDLRTRLNGKKARVRGNLNGKRVDQSARTVISGDSSYDIDVLGVPSTIMNKLTFPEAVNDQNLKELCACVARGAYVNNGALAVKPPNHATDTVFWLPILDREGRIELASQLQPGWIVERHLRENDWILFNRQPTLWKASMMAFRCKRVEGLTIRVPLVVTRAFNADFDGDEMNLHSLQGYEAIAEAQELMRVDNQIITPQSGNVVIGLVQDSLVGAWRLSAQDVFFNLPEALDLLMAMHYEVPGKSCGLSDFEYTSSVDSKTLPRSTFDLKQPAIFYKRDGKLNYLWTGKQLASTLIPTSINTQSDSASEPMKDFNSASGLLVREGLILCGRLSKTSLGASNKGLIQGIWRLYGPGGAHKFISDAQRLFVKHLCHDGPTQSIMDCLAGSETIVMDLLSRDLGRSDAILALNLPEEVKEAKSLSILQETLRAVGSSVLKDVTSDCALADCVNSGSKGNVMNIAQIGGCVGQQTVYGRRIPIKHTRLGPRTLIYYAPGDLRAEARGFIANSYLRGLSPIETFEHQMAGREGIVATAVNTSETGYNQRRMIKGQESQKLGYDGMVRVSDNKIVQTSYGGDDLDGSRLERIRFGWLIKDERAPIDSVVYELDIVQRAIRMAKAHIAWTANLYKELDPTFACGVNIKAILSFQASHMPSSSNPKYLRALLSEILTLHKRHHSAQRPMWNSSIVALILQGAELCHLLNTETIKKIVEVYAKAMINPGEGVGALGASSIGEPSMQKTLNTFHYAGIADKNVTITGLPRFKQLINGVDTYETANMTAELRSFEDSKSALQISKVMLSEILDGDIILSRRNTLSSYFNAFGTQRGPFASKFGPTTSLEANCLTMKFNWTFCARKNLTLETIAKSLRAQFSFDAIVLKRPFWVSGFHIDIVLAPWISGAKEISEALKIQHQVRGLDYVRNAIVFQEPRWTTKESKLVKTSNHVVETEGSNVVHLAACAFIKPETVRTNNVMEAFALLGISAGIMVLQSELHLVLSFDGSYIDPRHTWLLADTMGRNGTLAAMNRHHMLDLGSSLLQEASFERSLEVFEEGAAHGRSDNLVGATERIIVGQPVGIGTGFVEIIKTQATPQTTQVMVKPIEYSNFEPKESEHKDLNKKEVKTNRHFFNAKAFGNSFGEELKACSKESLMKCVGAFRSSAAEKRYLPNMRFIKMLSEKDYRDSLESCWASQWTSQESSPLETEVHWTIKQEKCFGMSLVNAASNQSWQIEPIQKFNFGPLHCEINAKKLLDNSDVPFGVESTRVFMRQQTKFTRACFSLTLARQWTGHTNVQAEEQLLSSPGTFIAILEIIDPESVLQNRCSDAQLANAIDNRIP